MNKEILAQYEKKQEIVSSFDKKKNALSYVISQLTSCRKKCERNFHETSLSDPKQLEIFDQAQFENEAIDNIIIDAIEYLKDYFPEAFEDE